MGFFVARGVACCQSFVKEGLEWLFMQESTQVVPNCS